MILNLPPYLLILIIILVIIPTLIAIILRFALYRELEILDQNVIQLIKDSQHRYKIKKIIEDIEKRFTETSNNLYQVNTPALIDQVYSHQKLGAFYYEDIEYFIKILPNLLLAFGLLGTFLGITINLSSISQIVTQTKADDVTFLLQQLQEPLQGMGIAFTTSLIGLFSSALLTVISLIFNTQKAKLRWIISLEDYLDNVYLPETQGDSRLDKIVNRMVNQQDDFLKRFHDNVTQAVESSLGRRVDDLVAANQQSNESATTVFNSVTNAAGTIGRAADDFQKAVQIFQNSDFPQQLNNATTNLQAGQNDFSQAANNLALAIDKLQDLTTELINLKGDITSINQQSSDVLNLTKNNQNSLAQIIPQLQKGLKYFALAVEKLQEMQQMIENKPDNLAGIQKEISKLFGQIMRYTEGINLAIEYMGDRFVDSVGKQLQQSTLEINNQLQAILNQIQNQSQINNINNNNGKKQTQPPENEPDIIEKETYKKAVNVVKKGNYDQGLMMINNLLHNTPDNPQFLLLRARIYQQKKELKLAREDYELILELSDNPNMRRYAEEGLRKAKEEQEIYNVMKFINDDD